jgi:hypothetical protein
MKKKIKSRYIGLHDGCSYYYSTGALCPLAVLRRETQSRRLVAAVAIVIAATVAIVTFVVVKNAPEALALRVSAAVIRAFILREGIHPLGVYLFIAKKALRGILVIVVGNLGVVVLILVGRRLVVLRLGKTIPVFCRGFRGFGRVGGHLLGLGGTREEGLIGTGWRSVRSHSKR